MKDPIKLLKLGWRTGMTATVVSTMVLGGLALNLSAAFATNDPQPNLTVRHLGVRGGDSGWTENVNLNQGDEVHFYAEIHNTVVGSRADNVTLTAAVTGGTFTDGTSTATASANNASSASDTINIHINGGGQLQFVPNSTRVTWDVNGDGNKEYNNTFVAGNPFNGLLIGDQDGCNQYIIQVGWSARVVGGTQPSPSPSPTPSVSPSPTPTPVASPTPPPSGGNNQDQDQEQEQDQEQNQDVDVNVEQNNNQTVNITNPAPPAVAGVKVPLKQPETGVSVLGLASMAGAAPVGLALSRFGRGRVVGKKDEEETLGEFAKGLIGNRSGKSESA